MPARNVLKEYEEGGYYHVYNRGVEKRTIFADEEDYQKFIGYLKVYLLPTNLQGLTLKDEKGRTVSPSRRLNNYANEIELISYCLMPNHFHLMLRQVTEKGMAKFIQSILTKYVRYFNKKYSRVGGLFQGVYKTVHVKSEEQFTYLTKYIHRNPLPDTPTRSHLEGLREYKYSSYGNYLGLFKQSWVKSEDILSYFSKTNPRNSYQSFVEETGDIAQVYKEMIDLDD
ncbi:MAG: transposase [bacterium]